MVSLDYIIDELDHYGDNGGPPDEDRDQIISQLRNLRDGLTHLIRSIELQQPLDMAKARLATAAGAVQFHAIDGGKSVLGMLPATGIASGLTYAVYALIGSLTGDPAAQTVVAGAAGAAVFAKLVTEKSKA